MSTPISPVAPNLKTKNFRILAALIAANKEHFNLSNWYYNPKVPSSHYASPDSRPFWFSQIKGLEDKEFNICGTVACLCGWVNYILDNREVLQHEFVDSSTGEPCKVTRIQWSDRSAAADWLGIPYILAKGLFCPCSNLIEDNEYSYSPFWSETFEAGIITNNDPYSIHVDEVVDMLNAIADKTIVLSDRALYVEVYNGCGYNGGDFDLDEALS